MTIFGSVRNLFVNSSVCLVTQSMINSGNQEIRLLFTLIILLNESGFVLSKPTSTVVPDVIPSPIRTIGPHISTPRPHLRDMLV